MYKGKGTSLFKTLKGIYLKSLVEEMRLNGKERTAYLTHLALLNILKKIKREVCDIHIKGLSYERWEYYVGILVASVLRLSIHQALEVAKERFPLHDFSRTELTLTVALTSGSFVYIKEGLWKTPFNPYSLNPEIHNGLERLSEDLAFDARAAKALIERVRKDGEMVNLIRDYKKIERFRLGVLNYLYEFEDQSLEECAFLAHIVRSEKEYRTRTIKAINRLIKAFPREKRKVALLERLKKGFGKGAILRLLHEEGGPPKGCYRGSSGISLIQGRSGDR